MKPPPYSYNPGCPSSSTTPTSDFFRGIEAALSRGGAAGGKAMQACTELLIGLRLNVLNVVGFCCSAPSPPSAFFSRICTGGFRSVWAGFSRGWRSRGHASLAAIGVQV